MVIVLIDALRADFVFDRAHQFPGHGDQRSDQQEWTELPKLDFVRELLRSGRAKGVTAKANPPTVTLPRIKVSLIECVTFHQLSVSDSSVFFHIKVMLS